MKGSQYYMPTLKESPAEAEIMSHKLMLRAGLIRKVGSGIYSYLPLGMKVLRKIENIIREELVRAGALEVLMPAIHPAELWQETGRWEIMGDLMMRFKDRKGHEFAIGPTHEEIITDLVRNEVRSYKQLPLNLFQIQTKVRDEIRPRFGVMRSREFIMKDAYSFDMSDAGMDESYQKMYDAYIRIFERCGLSFRPVEADTGAIGGKTSHEFMVLAESGEDAIIFCEDCNYAANIERATSSIPHEEVIDEALELNKVSTPDVKTIEDLVKFFEMDGSMMVKTLFFMMGETMVAALVRGDDELNEAKLAAHLGAPNLRMATDEEVLEQTGVPVGFVGPVNLNEEVRIVADPLVMKIRNGIAGANEKDYHFKNVNPGRDFTVAEEDVVDLRTVREGEACNRCGSTLRVARGIEVGHVFKLGTKYSEAMGATILDENGKERPMLMGCYGIGVTRIIGAAIEQNNDENGIIWPMAIAPFQVAIVPIGKGEANSVAEKIYEALTAQGIEVLLDDRKERPGVKFKDADLIGYPVRVTIGDRGLNENIVEVKFRDEEESQKVEVNKVIDFVTARVKSQLK